MPAGRSLVVGYGLGFFVAAQLGPMSLFLIRSTLRAGLAVGLAIGAGIASVDACYAALGAAGITPLLLLDPVRIGAGVAGGLVLVVLGVRSFVSAVHVREGLEGPAEVAGPRRAFLTALGATASNPATIVSWAAIFAAASATDGGRGPSAVLVAGVAAGSLTWVTVLAAGTAVAGRALGPRAVRCADLVAGVGMTAFGASMAVRTIRSR